jgi:benzodiazapine receptor
MDIMAKKAINSGHVLASSPIRPEPTGLRLWLGLIGFLIACFAIGGLGGLITYPAIQGWYNTLNKPSWNPPNWVFGPVWNLLFLLAAIAVWLVWRRQGMAGARLQMAIFTVQLALNLLWSAVFFGLHRPDLALIVALLLWIAVAAMVVTFRRVRPLAGILMIPYCAWVTFAIVLNYSIWQMNA